MIRSLKVNIFESKRNIWKNQKYEVHDWEDSGDTKVIGSLIDLQSPIPYREKFSYYNKFVAPRITTKAFQQPQIFLKSFFL